MADVAVDHAADPMRRQMKFVNSHTNRKPRGTHMSISSSNGIRQGTVGALKSVAYLAMLGIPLLTPLGICLGAPWLSFAVVYGVVPLLDLVIGRDPTNAYVAGQRANTTSTLYFYLIPHLYAVVWLVTLISVLHWLSAAEVSTGDLIWIMLSLGNASSFATCAAHELLHRRGSTDYLATRLIMSICWYGHFIIEHLHHHSSCGHVPSGTVPQRGEGLYRFMFRNVLFGLRNTTRLENSRLRRLGLPMRKHRVLQQYAVSICVTLAVYLVFGPLACVVYLCQAIYSALSVEIIQYLEHYGLTREEDERISATHAWNNDLFVTNAITLNITRHSDHHLNIRIPYEHLRADPKGPAFPVGYFGLAWLAIIPPLWCHIVDRHVDRELAQKSGKPPVPAPMQASAMTSD